MPIIDPILQGLKQFWEEKGYNIHENVNDDEVDELWFLVPDTARVKLGIYGDLDESFDVVTLDYIVMFIDPIHPKAHHLGDLGSCSVSMSDPDGIQTMYEHFLKVKELLRP